MQGNHRAAQHKHPHGGCLHPPDLRKTGCEVAGTGGGKKVIFPFANSRVRGPKIRYSSKLDVIDAGINFLYISHKIGKYFS